LIFQIAFICLSISLGQCGHGSLMRLRVLGTPNLIILSNLDTSIDNSCPTCPKISPTLESITIRMIGQVYGTTYLLSLLSYKLSFIFASFSIFLYFLITLAKSLLSF